MDRKSSIRMIDPDDEQHATVPRAACDSVVFGALSDFCRFDAPRIIKNLIHVIACDAAFGVIAVNVLGI